MKEIDEFIYFLVGGLLILGVLLAIFGLVYVSGPTGTSTLLGFGSPIFVGTNEFDSVETLYASFDANNYLQTNVFNAGSRRISNGLLFGATFIVLDIGNAGSTFVSFDVTNTNRYGALIIRLDDKAVYEQLLDEGHYEFSLGPANRIEIGVRSSEWRIWAPAIYDLDNVKITANVYPREISTFTFELEEPEKIETARVDFNLRDNAGALIIKLNGNVVYDGAMNPRQSIFVDNTKLDNLNIITFDAREDSKFSGLATIALTRKTLQEKELQAVVNLTQDEYNKFSTGTLAFDVVDVFRPGGYNIKIINGDQLLLNEFVKLERGYFEFTLKKENLRPGLNIIVIRSLDDAAFNIQGLITRL